MTCLFANAQTGVIEGYRVKEFCNIMVVVVRMLQFNYVSETCLLANSSSCSQWRH